MFPEVTAEMAFLADACSLSESAQDWLGNPIENYLFRGSLTWVWALFV